MRANACSLTQRCISCFEVDAHVIRGPALALVDEFEYVGLACGLASVQSPDERVIISSWRRSRVKSAGTCRTGNNLSFALELF